MMCHCSTTPVSVVSAVERAATCLVRVMVEIPRLWPKLFRFIMTPCGPCTLPECHPSPSPIPLPLFLPEWAQFLLPPSPPPHPYPLFQMTAHHTFLTVIHQIPRNKRPLVCKIQADSTVSCTQRLLLLLLLTYRYCQFYFTRTHFDLC